MRRLAHDQTPPDPDLSKLRESIDALDDEIVRLLQRRAEHAVQVGKVKATRSEPMYVPSREREVVQRLTEQSQGPLPAEAIRSIYREIISASLALEAPMSVAYLGPEATFTHEAARKHFGSSANLVPRGSIKDVFEEVERKRCSFGVVPIENSTEGIVNYTLDMFMSVDLGICAEVLLPVHHCLVSRGGERGSISKICSHPQALAQCREWLERNFPEAPRIDVSSTALAAQKAAGDASLGAVASKLAAQIYNLSIVEEKIEDHSGNLTRFLVIGYDPPKPSGNDRTSIMFALKDRPGILFRALEPFAKRNISLSRIESRPSRRRAWDYLFFIDLVGHRDQEAIAAGVAELEEACAYMKVLGSYPQASDSAEVRE